MKSVDVKTIRERRPYLFAAKQRVFVLHADKLGSSRLLSHLVEARELPAPHRTCAKVAHFQVTALTKVAGSFHRCPRVGGGPEVVSVNLENEGRGLYAREREFGPRYLCADAEIIGNETATLRRDHDLTTGRFDASKDDERCEKISGASTKVPF